MGIREKLPDHFLDALRDEFHFEPPREHGFDTVDAVRALRDGKARVFVGMGGNFLSASPDTDRTKEALQRTRLTVQISTKLNRSHLVTGAQALILPCLGHTEKDLQAGGRAVGHRGGLDVRACTPPGAAASRPVRTCSSEVDIVCRHRGGHARGSSTASTGQRHASRTTSVIRDAHRARGAGLRRPTT